MSEAEVERSRVDVRVLKALAPFASKEETRYYLNGVFVEIEPRSVTYAVTDGHRLVAYRDGLFDAENENSLLGSFIIPTAQCKTFKIKKDGIPAATLTYADEKRLTLTYEGLGVTFPPIDGTFPDWRGVLPKTPATGSPSQFTGDFVATFTKLARDLGLPDPFIAHNGEGPAQVQFGNLDHVIGALMPRRVDGDITRGSPSWARHAMAMAAE